MISIKQIFFAQALLGLTIFLMAPISTVVAQEDKPIRGARGVDVVASPQAARVVL